MRYIFYLGHPAHFHLFKNLIGHLKKQHNVIILARKKDVLLNLLERENIEYINLSKRKRKTSLISAGLEILKRDYKILGIARKIKPDLLLGTSISITHIGKLLRKPSIVFNEDDEDIVPLFAKLSYPFASNIVTPSICRVKESRGNKHIQYNGYHELAYLHPNYFTPDDNIKDERNRFAEAKRLSREDGLFTGLGSISRLLILKQKLLKKMEETKKQ